mgnify:CR=1 FL=1
MIFFFLSFCIKFFMLFVILCPLKNYHPIQKILIVVIDAYKCGQYIFKIVIFWKILYKYIPNVWCRLFHTNILTIFINIPMKDWDTETYYYISVCSFCGMVNLHYEIRICQKSITELQVTIKVNVWYEIARNRRYI